MRNEDQNQVYHVLDNDDITVRSLENMQGDEADDIVLFLNYHTKGFLHAQFWQTGGYKRLNVALTRSKRRMHLVHTLSFEEVEAVCRKKESQGGDIAKSAMMMKEFLNLVKSNSQGVSPPKINSQFDSPLEEDFYKHLQLKFEQLNRFALVPQVAQGHFRIDFGIYDRQQNEYVLGIELDGSAYHSGSEQIFYDSRRQKALKQVGWKIHRIWSTDWLKNPEHETQKLLRIITNIN
jgi:very-short-patch-repair endonuclease